MEEHARSIIEKLRDHGYVAVLAGGGVRDRLLGRTPKDYDVATSATPDRVKELFPHHVADGESQGVLKVIAGSGKTTDVATLRKDGSYSDGRRPDSVEFTSDLFLDSKRRDFTINSMFMTHEGTVIDYHNGQADMQNKLIRCVGEARDRFFEDRLRIMRAIRFSAQLGYRLDPSVRQGISATFHGLTAISGERIRDEWYKILDVPEVSNFRSALELMLDTAVLGMILPEVALLVGCDQDAIHHPEGDVWVHSLGVACTLKEMGEDSDTIFGGLLHDIGKKYRQTFWIDDQGRQRISNVGHAEKGAELAETVCKRFKLTNEQTWKITELVRLHMKAHDGSKFKRSTLINFLRHPYIEDLISLQHADGTNSAHADKTQRQFYLNALETLAPEIYSQPLIKGKDLIENGMEPGPHFTGILKQVRKLQDEGVLTTRDQAVKYALSMKGNHNE